MSKKKTDEFLEKPSVAAAEERLLDATTRGPATIPLGEVEPPGVGDWVLVNGVDKSGNTYPALVLAAGPTGGLVLEIHSMEIEKMRKMPNGQAVATGIPVPHTYILMTDEKGQLPEGAWFPRS